MNRKDYKPVIVETLGMRAFWVMAFFLLGIITSSFVLGDNSSNQTTVIVNPTPASNENVYLGILLLPFIFMVIGYVIRMPFLVFAGGIFLAVVAWLPYFGSIFNVQVRVIFTLVGLIVMYTSLRMTMKK